jgi:phosphatidylserine/phosphatidylglycerophosphate/cardiolipin synthase-like enzyme
MIRLILNDEHLNGVLEEALAACRRRLFVATADVKDLRLPRGGRDSPRRRSPTILDAFASLSARGVEIRLLHGGVPSGAFLADLKRGQPANLTMRLCPRVHAKAIIADGRWMYMGSANLTGAGLGAKSASRRNFEAGIVTDETPLIDPLADMLADVFAGGRCASCGRRDHCPVPLEEPDLGSAGETKRRRR